MQLGVGFGHAILHPSSSPLQALRRVGALSTSEWPAPRGRVVSLRSSALRGFYRFLIGFKPAPSGKPQSKSTEMAEMLSGT